MRNLVTLTDVNYTYQDLNLYSNKFKLDSSEISLTIDYNNETINILNTNGAIKRLKLDIFSKETISSISCANEDFPDGWLDIQFIEALSGCVCICLKGAISLLVDDGCVQEGVIEGGINAVQWSPDKTKLLISTNNDTLILMTDSFDILNEIPFEPRVDGTKCIISWRGDAECFAIYSVDKHDQIPRVRIFNNEMELIAVSRNIGEGSAVVLKGLLPAVAYSRSGLIAVGQQKSPKKLHIAFLEKNGLKHGEFEVYIPDTSSTESNWMISSLHWNISSSLLAVTLKCCNEGKESSNSYPHGAVLLYTRNNYHWYLKQSWRGEGISCLGFDSDVAGKIYLHSVLEDHTTFVTRVVEVVWDTTSSQSNETSVAVIDGKTILLTPLGIATVPPPMSRYKAELLSPARYVSFWKRNQHNQHRAINSTEDNTTPAFPPSGGEGLALACLCESDNLRLWFLDSVNGQPVSHLDIDFSDYIMSLEKSSRPQDLLKTYLSFRAISVTETDNEIKFIISSGPLVMNSCLSNSVDNYLHIFTISPVSGSILSYHSRLVDGIIYRVVPIPNQNSNVAIGLLTKSHEDVSFDIHNIPLDENKESLKLATFIEPCTCISIVSHQNKDTLMCFGMTSKNKLYMGEMLIRSGINSFAFNLELGMLLYVTIGTKPKLHFCSLEAMEMLDPLMYENNQLLPIECGLPRPLERGARIVASVEGLPKVIIQLPRGNLEAFEPRALVLNRAAKLLDSNDFYNCLVLLRRQKVDLNFIVDYNPQNFLDCIDLVICKPIQTKNDLLSLLITSLEEYDSTCTKYLIPGLKKRVYPDQFLAEGKINTVCKALREELEKQTSVTSYIINPIICTLAKQRPPLISTALTFIRSLSNNKDHAHLANETLRYLSFLVEPVLIFNTALGECDFTIARLIAKISQMDPKIFNPLILSFESIRNLGNPNDIIEPNFYHIYDSLMRYEIHIHLKNNIEASTWAIEALFSSYDFTSSDVNSSENIKKLTGLQNQIINEELLSSLEQEVSTTVSNSKIFDQILPDLTRRYLTIKKFDNKFTLILNNILYNVRNAYGKDCLDNMKYHDAVTAFLSMTPPNAKEALRAARLLGDWQRAIIINGRFLNTDGVSTKALVQEILSDYRESLNQGGVDDFESNFVDSTIPDTNESIYSSKDIEASRLCLEYLDDVESAVDILLTSRKFIDAIQAALIKSRYDLIEVEILNSCKDTALTLIKYFKKRSKEHLALISELNVTWLEPANRLSLVASTEPALFAVLNGEEFNQTDETKSEFTSGSSFSQSSYVSNMSIYSDSSQNSMMSASSSVSVMSINSNRSNYSISSNSNFSIEGLDHSLLSRGLANPTRKIDTEKSSRKKKKKGKSLREKRGEGRSESKDVWGLRKEYLACESLMRFSNIENLVTTVDDLCNALLFISEKVNFCKLSPSIILAAELQTELGNYIEKLSSNKLSQAPEYPLEWLEKRNMKIIRYFQSSEFLKIEHFTTYSRMIEIGISKWGKLKKLSLKVC